MHMNSNIWDKISLWLKVRFNSALICLSPFLWICALHCPFVLTAFSFCLQPEKVKFQLRLGQSKPIYNAFKAIQDSPQWPSLSDARKRIVECKYLKLLLLSEILLCAFMFFVYLILCFSLAVWFCYPVTSVYQFRWFAEFLWCHDHKQV